MGGKNDRIAGGILVAASLASVLMMTHHPSDAHDYAMGQFVHGAMITIVGAMTLGLIQFARVLGLDRLTVLAGLIAYGIALFGDVGAAVIDGFVVTNLVARGVEDRDVFALAWEANQALARLGVVATGVAFMLWSIRPVTRGGWAGKAIGALGIVAGLAPMVLLGTGLMNMHLHGAILIYGGQAAWMALAGLYLWSGRMRAEVSV
ncbi:hypothetical protein OF829_02435 [Sphingomonas sp. LB-2]|uniref:hypothetical protein n=1 Tax=Sphingomonas caeni TaxID=2984949 RepID=UPI0022307826|nr:hypothetical protein [Sphingomonas caeni]MCW3846078.1 hypothetical protein [Sphingomonas caeni]